MTDELPLFGDDAETPAPIEPRASDEQVASLRDALDALGVRAVGDRQRIIEELAHRPLASLRDLRAMEANVVLSRLRERARPKPESSSGSAWENRNGDTWIDRL